MPGTPGADLWLCVVWQLISDAGYQGEITSVSTACQQLEVFSRVLRTSLATILDGGEENLEKNLPEFAVSPSESQATGKGLAEASPLSMRHPHSVKILQVRKPLARNSFICT